MAGESVPARSQGDELRRLVPLFSLAVAIVAVVADPSSAAYIALALIPVGAFALWAYVPRVPLPAIALVVLVPIVAAQSDGKLEPLLFDATLLAFAAGRWSPSLAQAVALGVLAPRRPSRRA